MIFFIVELNIINLYKIVYNMYLIILMYFKILFKRPANTSYPTNGLTKLSPF